MSTGSLKIDNILDGIWGFPKGQLTEVFGPSGSGKSSIVLSCIRDNTNSFPVLVDSEYKFDARYAAYMGLDLPRVIILQSNILDNIEQLVELTISAGSGIVIIDTISAVQHEPKKFNKIMVAISELLSRDVAIILVSQVRKNWNQGKDKTESYYSNVAGYYPALRICLDYGDSLSYGNSWDNNLVTGRIMNVEVVKNRFGSKSMKTSTELHYGIGINKPLEVLDEAFSRGLITRSGSWYFYRNNNLGEGRLKASIQLSKLPVYASILDAVQRRNQ